MNKFLLIGIITFMVGLWIIVKTIMFPDDITGTFFYNQLPYYVVGLVLVVTGVLLGTPYLNSNKRKYSLLSISIITVATFFVFPFIIFLFILLIILSIFTGSFLLQEFTSYVIWKWIEKEFSKEERKWILIFIFIIIVLGLSFLIVNKFFR